MFTKVTFAATNAVAATIATAATLIAAPVLGSQSTSETVTKASNIAAQGWCTGPRQHTDFRCS
jgi:hypothetical protein